MKRLAFYLIAASYLFVADWGYAAQRIAVLDFELNDITSLPNTPAERQRTASMAPMLRRSLAQADGYQIVYIDPGVQTSSNPGLGYLFRFDDLVARLGREYGADWIVVSQHSKPSFLYSYLMVHLIRVNSGALVGRYDIELKGNHAEVTRHGIERLSAQIRKAISTHSASLISSQQ
jgi:hypothetical protein